MKYATPNFKKADWLAGDIKGLFSCSWGAFITLEIGWRRSNPYNFKSENIMELRKNYILNLQFSGDTCVMHLE